MYSTSDKPASADKPPFPLRNKFLKKTVNPDSQRAHAKKVEGIREIKQWASHDIQMAAMSACWPGCFQGTYSGHLDHRASLKSRVAQRPWYLTGAASIHPCAAAMVRRLRTWQPAAPVHAVVATGRRRAQQQRWRSLQYHQRHRPRWRPHLNPQWV